MSRRHLVIAGSVVLFHAAALWALHSGLARRTIELVIPARMVSEIITPEPARIEAPRPAAAPAPAPAPKPVARKVERPRPAPAAPPAPRPVAVPDPAPALVTAATGVPQPQPPAPPVNAPVAAAPAPAAAAPAAPARELPSSSADYLQNPPPAYPAMSKRLGEQGTVIVRVQIGADGVPLQANVKQGSGFERLDRAAVDYVMKCRYVPGKVGGVPQTMWYDAPVKYNLE